MKKGLIFGAAAVVALAIVGCTGQQKEEPQGLVIERQGVFSSGGRVTEPIAGEYDATQNWLDMERKGTTTHVDHANTFYQIPANGSGLPMVFLHGYGQTRTGWQSTSDGREGWSDLFLKKGYSVFLVDQPRRGAAGATEEIVNNKEHLPLRQTTDVTVYDLTTHMPIYYRTFPGNIPDSRSVGIILKDLSEAGMQKVVLITDRGYESVRNLETYILGGQPMIMWVKVRQSMVLGRIREMGAFTHCPDGMEVDEDRHVYYRQYDLDYKVDVRKGCTRDADRLRLNLYFDPVRRGAQLMELDIDIKRQRRALEEAKAAGYPMDDDVTLKRLYPCFMLEVDESDRSLRAFALNEKKVEEARLASGFSACVTHALDYTAVKASESYALRDEQEKGFGLQKGPLGSDRQRCWSEDGKNGRLFVLFVAMILGSHVRHVRQTTELKKMFCSYSEILDEMRPIRCIEHKGHARRITPFVGKQLEICRVFGFPVPEGCDIKYKSKKVGGKKRGRPKKAVVVSEPKE